MSRRLQKIFLFNLVFFALLFVSENTYAQQNLDSLLVRLESATSSEEKNDCRKQLALHYESQSLYGKSVEYYNLIYNSNILTQKESRDVLRRIGALQMQTSEFEAAMRSYNKLLGITTDTEEKVNIYEKLAEISRVRGNEKQALNYLIRALYTRGEEPSYKRAVILNNIGHLEKSLGNHKSANKYFEDALDVNESLIKDSKEKNQHVLHINKATNLVYLGRLDDALSVLRKDIDIQRRQNSAANEISSLNFIGAVYLLSNNLVGAKDEVFKAIGLGKKLNNNLLLAESYKVLSEIHNKENNFQESQAAFKKHQSYLSDNKKEVAIKERALIDKEIKAEKEERAIKEYITNQRTQEMQLAQMRLESDKREQDFKLLKQQEELQQAQLKTERLERERYRQVLALTEQKLEAERKEKAIASLKAKEQLQSLEIKREKLEKGEQAKALKLLEAEKKIQDQELIKEAEEKRYTYIGIGLVSFLMLAIGFAFIQQQRANKKLEAQRQEIAARNEELSNSKRRIDQSIASAQLIQNATLPTLQAIKKHVDDHFIVYLPQQVVSGDFYWIEKIQDKVVVILADCTGHGVSGAFMTLIGNALLNEIIKNQGTISPSVILDKLHERLQNVLQQKETGNSDGMDISVLILEEGSNGKNATFASAKQTFYYVDQKGELNIIKGSRKTIGGVSERRNRKAKEHHLFLPKDTILYLASDGYADQNDINRKKFGSRRFESLLKEISDKPLEKQRDILLSNIEEHSKGVEQRDDITVIGMKV